MKKFIFFFISICILALDVQMSHAQSVARQWNNIILENIRGDFARPTVHARNLFHMSAAMYDAWALYDDIAEPCFMGKEISGYNFELADFPQPTDIEAARNEAVSYAAFRILRHRFAFSPEGFIVTVRMNSLMNQLGYDINNISTDYESGSPAALGNYIAEKIIDFGLNDGAGETIAYGNYHYQPVNDALVMGFGGNSTMTDPNRWQPLTLDVFIDQSGNVIPFNTPPFLSPEWGNVVPFALSDADLTVHQRDGEDWKVYHDPGPPPLLSADGEGEASDLFRWGFQMVSIWSSHLDPNDNTLIDISPASIGNIAKDAYPSNFADYGEFYDYFDGGDPSQGHAVNPHTGMPYEPQMVKRSDYGRILAEYWADGPDSETPPGHWFTILNYVNDHPEFERKFRGEGELMDELEWDVKAYLLMGGAMHDCAITAWGIKGYYDYVRPVSAIRYMAEKGQRTDPGLPSYDPHGFDLIPGYIEVIEAGDPLALADPANIGEIKIYAWRGPDFISSPSSDTAGVGWILAKEWWPYQRPSFVTPNFAGYVSGHSTYSSAAAEILETLTGDAFFPGGMGEFEAPQNDFLVFEQGPTEDIVLQWATYKDASEQTSLSRIWGGIHPPADDIPGRIMGTEIAINAFDVAENLFFLDEDEDGWFYFEDCNDNDADVNPDIVETCNGIDDDCNGLIDDGLPLFAYYLDADQDGFGDVSMRIDTCQNFPPTGYVEDFSDCFDGDAAVSPDGVESCNGIDDNCSGLIDDGIPYFEYWMDNDGDGFGDASIVMDTCLLVPPVGFVDNDIDCDDNNAAIYPGAPEVPDNGIDEDCTGVDYYRLTQFFPNPVSDILTIRFETLDPTRDFHIFGMDGKAYGYKTVAFENNEGFMDISDLSAGLYYLIMFKADGEKSLTHKILVL